jgi:hypothetical protein
VEATIKLGLNMPKGFVSEDRHAPYVHDRHRPYHGVRSASSRRVVTTADGVIRTMTTGGDADDGWRAVDARRPPMRSLSRDRSRLALWLPAVKGRIIKSWFNHGSVGRPGPVCW